MSVCIFFSKEILVYYFNSKHFLYTMTNQRFKKKKKEKENQGFVLPAQLGVRCLHVALPNCQLEQVGFTAPLNSGQAEVTAPRLHGDAPLETFLFVSLGFKDNFQASP